MLWTWVVFGLPLTGVSFEWIVLSTRRRDQLRHLTVVAAMTFSTASTLLGIGALLYPGQLRLRAGTDYGLNRRVDFSPYWVSSQLSGGLPSKEIAFHGWPSPFRCGCFSFGFHSVCRSECVASRARQIWRWRAVS